MISLRALIETGLLVLPVALATVTGASLTGRLIGNLGARTVGVTGLLVAAAGMTIAALSDGPALLIVGVAIAAAGTGSMFVVASATALGHVQPHEAGVASGIVSTFHEFGASLGAATVSSLAGAV